MNWRWPNFKDQLVGGTDVLSCSCCGVMGMQEDFLDKLQALRTAYARPMKITSGYRCPKHNKAVSSTGVNGPHTTGHAVDIQAAGEQSFKIIQLAMEHGFERIGVHRVFVHLDDSPMPYHPRPRIWPY